MNDIDAEVEEDPLLAQSFTQSLAPVLTNEPLPQTPVPLVGRNNNGRKHRYYQES